MSDEEKQYVRDVANEWPFVTANSLRESIRLEILTWGNDADFDSDYLISKDIEVLIHSADEYTDLKYYIDASENVRFDFNGDKITLINR